MSDEPAEGGDHVAGSFDRAPGRTPRSRSDRSPLLVAGVVVAVFAGVFGAFIAFRPVEPAPTYDERTRVAFVDACAADGGSSTRPVCECAYDEMVLTISYEGFRELDASARARLGSTTPPGSSSTSGSDTTSRLPTAVQEIMASCVAGASPTTVMSVPTTDKSVPTTAPPRPPTTTPAPGS